MQHNCLWRAIFACMLIQALTVVIIIALAFHNENTVREESAIRCAAFVERPSQSDKKPEKRAFVTLISPEKKHRTGIGYAECAVTMLHTLRKFHGSEYSYVAMITDGVPQKIIDLLLLLNFTVEAVSILKSPHGNRGPKRWEDTYTKLWIWSLEDYSKVVYFDADHIIVKPMPELFDYPELSAVPNFAYKIFTAGMMVLEPSVKTLNSMFSAMQHPECHKTTEMDQSFLNWYFPDWHELPLKYSSNDVIDSHPRFDEIKAIHGKPFELSESLSCTKCADIFFKQWREIESLMK